MSTRTWLAKLMNRPVLIYRRVPDGIDEYGNITYTDEEYVTTGFIRPMSGVDIQLGRATLGTHVLVLPAEAADQVDGFSRYVVDGVTYEADGPGDRYVALHETTLHHIEINVTKTTA